MDPTGAALLRAVLFQPDDNTLRLVFVTRRRFSACPDPTLGGAGSRLSRS